MSYVAASWQQLGGGIADSTLLRGTLFNRDTLATSSTLEGWKRTEAVQFLSHNMICRSTCELFIIHLHHPDGHCCMTQPWQDSQGRSLHASAARTSPDVLGSLHCMTLPIASDFRSCGCSLWGKPGALCKYGLFCPFTKLVLLLCWSVEAGAVHMTSNRPLPSRNQCDIMPVYIGSGLTQLPVLLIRSHFNRPRNLLSQCRQAQ
jgi:hypothetical protein